MSIYHIRCSTQIEEINLYQSRAFYIIYFVIVVQSLLNTYCLKKSGRKREEIIIEYGGILKDFAKNRDFFT